MTALIIIVAVFGAGALVTLVGTRLVERAHRPGGRFIEIDGLPQHVVEIGAGEPSQHVPPIVLLHGAGANLADMRVALDGRFSSRHRLVFVDRPGLGYSARRDEEGAAPAAQAR